MSCGEPKNSIHESILTRAAEQIALEIDNQIMKQMYMTTTAIHGSINNWGAQGSVGPQGAMGPPGIPGTAAYYSSPSTVFNGGLSINGANNYGGTLTTNNTGGLQWNGNYVQTSWDTPKINRISDMLKDNMSKEIIMCASREECQRKYGEYGVKLFDSMLGEVLQEAIKSEETFNNHIQLQLDKYNQLKALVMSHLPEDVLKQVACLELGLLN
jgi:hypothetical protein